MNGPHVTDQVGHCIFCKRNITAANAGTGCPQNIVDLPLVVDATVFCAQDIYTKWAKSLHELPPPWEELEATTQAMLHGFMMEMIRDTSRQLAEIRERWKTEKR